MNERELADLFNQQWDAVQSGMAPRRGDTPLQVRQALEMAGKVAHSDFSADSRARETLRRRIMTGEMYWEAAVPSRPPARNRLVGVLRLSGYAAGIALFILAVSLTIRSFLPRSQPPASLASPVAAIPLVSTPTELAAFSPTITEAPPTPPPVLSLESLPESIQATILDPAWETLWVQGEAISISPSGESSTFQVQGWLGRDGAGRVLSTDQLPGEVPFDPALEPRWVWASDGQSLLLYDHQTGEFDSTAEATRWSDHPLEMAGLVVEMLFPSSLAGSTDDLKVVEYATQAGRPAVVVDWGGARYWLDSETGVILRRQRFDEAGNLVEDVSIQSIVYNPDLPEDLTDSENIESAPFEPVPTSQPGDISSSPPVRQTDQPTPTPLEPPTATPIPTASDTIVLSIGDDSSGDISGRDSKGDLYFTLRSSRPPFDRQLVWTDSGCVFSLPACHALLTPGLPEAFDNQLHWSPDGNQAVLIDSANSRLLRFDPRSGTFSTLANDLMATMDVAVWSPDGAWIALTVENEQKDGSLITLVNPEQVSNQPDIQTLTADLAGIQMPLAWLDENTLLFFRHSTQNKDGSGQFIEPGLYRLDLRRGLVSEMPVQGSWEWLKNYPAASPDGSQLVLWTELDGQRQLAVLDLGNVSLGGSQLTPLGVDGSNPVWSPNGKWIAFTTTGEDEAGQPNVAVNLIHPDGSGLRQIFTWGSTPSITWAPDNRRLIITAYPTGQDPENDLTALYLVTLADGRQQHILLEEAYQYYEFIAASFR